MNVNPLQVDECPGNPRHADRRASWCKGASGKKDPFAACAPV